ncbi:MAG: hypothetical protein QOE23_329 [Pseudonocardiales bacterium]|nr:hypothetical protein [Pseudonocardiales bacterium]
MIGRRHLWIAPARRDPPRSLGSVTDPHPAPAPDGTDLVLRISAAADGIVGIGDGPLTEAVSRLDALHSELQGALANLDQG